MGDAVASGEQCVRERPRIAVLTVFGLGLLAGVALAAALRPVPRHKPGFAESVEDSRERLVELLGTVASNVRHPLKKTYGSVTDRATNLGEIVAGALANVRSERKFPWK